MRTVFAALFLCAVAQPALSQTFLKSEPHTLAPFATVYVDNGKCGAGKVLQVKGAVGAIQRKKTCVPMGLEEASRATAIR